MRFDLISAVAGVWLTRSSPGDLTMRNYQMPGAKPSKPTCETMIGLNALDDMRIETVAGALPHKITKAARALFVQFVFLSIGLVSSCPLLSEVLLNERTPYRGTPRPEKEMMPVLSIGPGRLQLGFAASRRKGMP